MARDKSLFCSSSLNPQQRLSKLRHFEWGIAKKELLESCVCFSDLSVDSSSKALRFFVLTGEKKRLKWVLEMVYVFLFKLQSIKGQMKRYSKV